MKKSFFIFFIIFFLLNGLLYSDEIKKEKFSPGELISMYLSEKKQDQDQAVNFIKLNLPVNLLPVLYNNIMNEDDYQYIDKMFGILKIYPDKQSIDTWIDLLNNSQDNNVKLRVIYFLGQFYNKKSVRHLIKQLKSEYFDIRKAAIISLNKIGDDRMYPAIFKLARDENPIFRLYAAESLYHSYDMRLLPIIQKMINDQNKSVRIYILKCIEKNGISDVLPLVRQLVRRDNNYEVRINGINVLLNMGDRSSKSVLDLCLKHERYEVRKAAVNALYQMNFNSVYNVAVALGNETNYHTKDLMLDYIIKYRSCSGAYGGLKNILLYEKSALLRIKSAFALGLVKGFSANNILIDGLKDDDYRVRAEISNSLSAYRNNRTVHQLLKVIKYENNLYVKSAALYSLAKMKNNYIKKELIEFINSEENPVFIYLIKSNFNNY